MMKKDIWAAWKPRLVKLRIRIVFQIRIQVMEVRKRVKKRVEGRKELNLLMNNSLISQMPPLSVSLETLLHENIIIKYLKTFNSKKEK